MARPRPNMQLGWVTSLEGAFAYNGLDYLPQDAAASVEDIGPMIAEFVEVVIPPLQEVLSSQYSIIMVTCRLELSTDVYQQTELTVHPGLHTGSPLPNQDCAVIRKHFDPGGGGRIRRGRLSLSGCPEDQVTFNVWSSSFNGLLGDVAEAVEATLTRSGVSYAPFVYSVKNDDFYALADAEAVGTVKSIRRRRPYTP